VDVEFLMSDGSYQYAWIASLSASSGWQTFRAQVTPPTGAVSFTVLHILARVGTLTIDNASLTALNVPFTQGMVTLSFDDGLLSQFQNALPMLNTAGMKATFFIITTEPTSGDSGSMTWTQIKNIGTQGFEIAGHTRTHPFLTQLTPAQLTSEVTGSFTDLVAQGFSPKTFAYPYGDVNQTVEAAVKNAGYLGARGSYFGVNGPVTDHYDLYDIRIDSTSNLATIESYIDQAKADKRWVVFELHDILTSGGDEYSITPAFLQSLITYIKNSDIQVVTVEQGIAQLNP
jgi:peptidoglycan/xylan/chitin deacetylase (PgdA/CDA1 family)